jgi:hypothetical protein
MVGNHPHIHARAGAEVLEYDSGGEGERKRVKGEAGKERVCDGSDREGGGVLAMMLPSLELSRAGRSRNA